MRALWPPEGKSGMNKWVCRKSYVSKSEEELRSFLWLPVSREMNCTVLLICSLEYGLQPQPHPSKLALKQHGWFFVFFPHAAGKGNSRVLSQLLLFWGGGCLKSPTWGTGNLQLLQESKFLFQAVFFYFRFRAFLKLLRGWIVAFFLSLK